MTKFRRNRWMQAAAILVAGTLLGEGCQTRDLALNLGTSTASRLGNLVLNALIVDPVSDALDDLSPDE